MHEPYSLNLLIFLLSKWRETDSSISDISRLCPYVLILIPITIGAAVQNLLYREEYVIDRW